jgi:nitroimidazol reductase NimA-like FMN-containing flavoprotein (pyridoxamine 5'-phosphate oxidase superfamily)
LKYQLRRKDREMTDRQAMEALLNRMSVGRLGLATEEGPYVVPMNYLYAEGCIYLHSALEGRKVDILKGNPRVCFLVDKPGPLVIGQRACSIGQLYESVMCFGRAGLVEGEKEKRIILEQMIRKLAPSGYSFEPLEAETLRKTVVVRIPVDHMTGKTRLPDPNQR